MEPKMIDCYNEMPYGINVIEKLNEEYEEILQRNKELEDQCRKLETKNKKLEEQYNKYNPPILKVSSLDEYNTFYEKIEAFEQFVKDIGVAIEDEGDDISRIIDNLSKVMGIDDGYELTHYTDNFNAYKKYLELISDIKNQYIITDKEYQELFRKIDQILELDEDYINALETKCFFLFVRYMEILEGVKDEEGKIDMDEDDA